MAKFGERLKGTKKQDNAPAAHKAKVQIRNHVLDAIGAGDAHVFDAFAGEGLLWRAVWHRAASYQGCELRFFRDDPRTLFCARNERVLRAINLAPFNIFDLDAYGSPWEQACIIADRRKIAPGERIGLLLTEGTSLTMRMNGLPGPIAYLAGFNTVRLPGAFKSRDEILARCLAGLCRRMRVSIVNRWQAQGRTGSQMLYAGLILEGSTDASQSPEQNVPF